MRARLGGRIAVREEPSARMVQAAGRVQAGQQNDRDAERSLQVQRQAGRPTKDVEALPSVAAEAPANAAILASQAQQLPHLAAAAAALYGSGES